MQSGVRERWKINTRFVLIDGGIHMKCRWRGRCTHSTHKPSDGEKRERRTAAKWPNNSWLGCWFRSAVSWRNFYAAPAKKTWRREQAGKPFISSRANLLETTQNCYTLHSNYVPRAHDYRSAIVSICVSDFVILILARQFSNFSCELFDRTVNFCFAIQFYFEFPSPLLSLSLSIQYIISISSLVAAAAAAAAPKESSKTSKTTPEEL